MADQVLGKRARSSSPPNGTTTEQPDAKRANGSLAGEKVEADVSNGGMEDIAEEDDDDDIGPMPDMPGEENLVKGKKKGKRAGRYLVAIRYQAHTSLVLPHEKLYLEHLPSANRYYKSFMHRDQINYVTITKYVPSSLALFPAKPFPGQTFS